MYPVTQDFLDKMKADLRRIDARVEVSYTDPFIDQSIAISASEQANVSYPQQTADAVAAPTHKWASLDGSWVLDGSYHLAPAPEDLTRYQFGYWSQQLAGPDGAFAAPYPSLTVTHIPRPVHTLRVVGDSARGEYPVDFRIDLYAQDGTLLRSETVTGNAAVEWSMTLPAPVLDVAKQVLTITRWSHPGRQAKVVEFFTSIQETYLSDDIVEIRLLEEREASQGSLPVGNITANELVIVLSNESHKFDPDNAQSPLFRLLKPNRRIRAWLGLRGAGDLWGDGWYASFDRDLALARRDGAVLEPLPGAVATLRPGEGRFGGAVAVEEGTTNLFANPTLSREAEQWVKSNSTVKNYDGYVRITASDTYAGVYQTVGMQEGVTYTLSYWYRHVSGAAVVGSHIDGWNESNTQIRIDKGPWIVGNVIDVPDDSQFHFIEVRHTPTSSGTKKVYLQPGRGKSEATTGDIRTGYGFGVQLEAKPFATSFVDGTRAAGRLEYPNSVFNAAEGTISMWVYKPRLLDYNARVFWTEGSGFRFGIHDSPGGRLVWAYITEGGGQIDGGHLTPNTWHFLTMVWNSDEGWMRGYVDAEHVAELTFSPGQRPGFVHTDTWGLGARVGGSLPFNGLIDELLILPYAASDEFIAELYRETRPLYDEWVPLGTFWSLDWDSPDDALEATVVARDRLELLRKSTYQPGQVQQNVSLYSLAEQVLQDAGLQPGEYWIDPALQQTVIPWAWLSPTSHREALRIIAEAALAVVYADRDGVVRIEAMGSVPPTPVLTITADDYFPPLQAPSRQDQVANEIVVATQPLRPADTPQEVYRSTTPITVPAGQTVTVQAKYNQTPVIEATASLDNPPAGVSITATTYYAWGAEVAIQNTGASSANVTLVITGKPLSVQGGEQVIARDQTSITENGVLRYEFPGNPLVQTLAQAQAIATALLASAKDPRRDIEVEWRGNPALELGDRVTVVGQDVHVIRQEITWAGALSARLTGRKVT